MSNELFLPSGIVKHYRKYFTLNEEALRRFQAILERAGNEISEDAVVIFYVEREDSRFYNTQDIQEVLSDPNVKNRRVSEVHIELVDRATNNIIVVFIQFISKYRVNDFFGYESRVVFKIYNDNKNWALLLSDELEPQLQRTFKPKGIPSWLLLLFIVPFGLTTVKWIVLNNEYLQLPVSLIMPITAMFVVFATTTVLLSLGNIKNLYKQLFGPESSFLWGDAAIDYIQREKNRSNLTWVVIVGLLVSLVASLLYTFLVA